MNPIHKKTVRLSQFFILLSLTMSLWACASSSSSQAGDDDSADVIVDTTVFPATLAVVSPLESSSVSSSVSLFATTDAQDNGYDDAVAENAEILNGDDLEKCADIDFTEFFKDPQNADCYGPHVAFENHPNFGDSEDIPDMYDSGDGRLPSGDVGIWKTNQPIAGGGQEACAAAELNARMQATKAQAQVSLKAMASLVCVSNVNQIPLPTNGTSDLTEEMNTAFDNAGIDFTTATLTQESDANGGDLEINYNLEFTVKDNQNQTRTVFISATHKPGISDDDYVGRFQYSFSIDDDREECEGQDPAVAGSALYKRSGTNLDVDVRSARFCSAEDVTFNQGIVDPTGNWSHDYDFFIANFDTSDLEGDYSYSWQAGHQDGNTRVFNVHLANNNDGILGGVAFAGYGADMSETDGSIAGFICNWAGPGNDHALESKVQRQTIMRTNGAFMAGESQITYAPVNGCDTDGSGGFVYDSDGDDSLVDEVSQSVTNNLADLDDMRVEQFVLPLSPENF